MAYQQRIGATSDSLRIRNNEWYVARSFDGNSDIKIFRVNTSDEIEFCAVPSVNGDSFVLMSQFEELEERVAILEAIVETISAGDINIVPHTWTEANILAKSYTLPQSPLPGTAVIIPANGIPQLAGSAFNVVGNQIQWSGMPYEQIAEEGDVVKIIYMFAYTP
jgi:hypothetical protein